MQKELSVWVWIREDSDEMRLVLFDGENTYWTDQMRPSSGYSVRSLRECCRVTRSKFFKMGEL